MPTPSLAADTQPGPEPLVKVTDPALNFRLLDHQTLERMFQQFPV
jgi:hypothetical protein